MRLLKWALIMFVVSLAALVMGILNAKHVFGPPAMASSYFNLGSIIGGAVTHLFYPPSAGGKFHLGGLIVSIIGAVLVLYVWHKFRLQLPRG